MPLTILPRAQKFTLPSILRIINIPAVASTSFIPTKTEIEAGTDITAHVTAWTGWEVTNSFIEAPDAASLVASKLPGRSQLADSSLDCWMDRAGTNDVRSVFTEMTPTFIGMFWVGYATGRKYDLFPATVSTITKVGDVGAQNATMLRVGFALTDPPARDLTVPAS